MNPARKLCASFIASAPSIRCFPRCVEPSRFTRRNSDADVSRRSLGNVSEADAAMPTSMLARDGQISVQQKSSLKRTRGKTLRLKRRVYGDGAGDVFRLTFVSVFST